MDLKLTGNVAVVTGAGSPYGYGRAIALSLAQEGCDLVVTYHKNAEGAQKTAAEIRNLGREAMAVKADVRIGPEVKQMVNTVIARFGKIDILVNNAGGPAVSPRPFVETDESDWNQDIDLNLKGTLQCTRAVLEHMISRRRGKIINISSMSARTGAPNVCVYESAKAGVIAFTKGLAAEVAASGINVNCVAPGFGLTDLLRNMPQKELANMLSPIPLKKATTPEDVGGAVAYLASDVAVDVVGQTLAVDGGLTMV